MASKRKAVLVLGATRETGLEVVKLFMARGEPVVAVARKTSDIADLKDTGAPIAIGDAFDRAGLERIFAEHDFGAVVSSLGGHPGDERRVDYEGSVNAIEAAKAAGVKRFIMITMIGAGDSDGAGSPEARQAFAKVRALKTRAEDYLKASGLDYTVLRPGGMKSEPATGRGMLSEDRKMMGVIHRADLAALARQCLDDDATIGRTYATVDREMIGTPKFEAPWLKKA